MIEDLLKEEKPIQLVVDLQDLRQLFHEVSKGSRHYQEIVERVSEPIPPATKERLISRRDVAELLSVNPTTVWRWQKMGKLKVYHMGRKALYKVSELKEFIEEHGLQ